MGLFNWSKKQSEVKENKPEQLVNAPGIKAPAAKPPIFNLPKTIMHEKLPELSNDTYAGISRVFSPSTDFVKVSRSEYVPSVTPGTGSRIYSEDRSKSYTLKAPQMTNNNSITYATNQPDVFAKIYTQDALRIDLFANKARRMVKEKVDIRGVCWPIEVLVDGAGGFVGVLVPASKGVQLNRSILSGTSGINQYFPKWDRRDLCLVSHTILDMICRLHRYGVYMGCLNPASIYIADANEVYFVDTDNLQLEGFPLITRNVTFTPPELITEQKKLRLFNRDEENYQLALLTFMLMMPGKYPYAKKRGGDNFESIKEMAFPFSIGGDMKRSADAERPSGVWQIIWDHLPYKMCNDFYNSFHANGKFSKPGTRLKDVIWLLTVDDYYNSLVENPKSDSVNIVPRTFRRDAKRTFEKCGICGQEHPSFYFLHTIRIQGERINIWDKGYRVCLPCAVDQSTTSFTCQSCKRTFYYTNRTRIMHEIGRLDFDWNAQKWCNDCKKHTTKCSNCGKDVPIYQLKEFNDRQRNLKRSVCGACFSKLLDESKRWKNEPYRRNLSCKQCGRLYDVTNGEAEFYSSKGMMLPSRCPTCRGRR